MAVTTPGIDFIVTTLTKLSLPPVLLAALVRVICEHNNQPIPTWALVTATAFAIPLIPLTRVAVTRIYHRYQARKLGARLAPEVPGRWIGNFDVMKKMRHMFEQDYPGAAMSEWQDQLGPVFNVRTAWFDRIVTTSPDYIKKILATDFNNFVKGPEFHHAANSVLGDGVFNSDGDMWKFHRHMTRPFFTRDRISDFDTFDEHASTAIQMMKERLRGGYSIDFQDLMSRFTLDSATAYLFGKSVHSLESGLPYPENVQVPASTRASVAHSPADEFAEAFLKSQEIISSRNRFGWIWPLWEIFGDRTKAPMKKVRAYLDPIIKEAVEKHKQGGGVKAEKISEEVGEGETLLDHLVALTPDLAVVRDETMNIMIAGRDTTSATLTFLVYLLARHPDVMTRLREEILDTVGPTKRPDYDDIKDMKYLRAVINETLRLFPIVPFNGREAVKATIWPSPDPSQPPIYIPAGTRAVYSVFVMHRRKELWGPDAEEFDPDRFLDERLKTYLVKNSFIFLPFNAGPRICLGQQFAYNEMSFMVIRLLQQFASISLDLDALPAEGRPKPEWKEGTGRKTIEQTYPKVHLTMYAQGGLWVKMKEADNTA